ncbi:MAG: substrate-binding domain-containing protein [Lachnospiraceae bacterium]|nr:substrate-binding domain-containing protein [Lachnospiraceae bacterium]
MERYLKKDGAIVLFFIFLVLFSAHAAADELHQVTGMLPNKSETVYWSEMIEAMYEAAEENGIELSILYTEEKILYTELTVNSALEIAGLSGAEAIILPYSKADEDTDELLLQLREAGVKIILVDCDGASELRDAFVGIDNFVAGYALGTYVFENLAEDQNVILSTTVLSSAKPNIAERIEGFQSAFEGEEDRLFLFEGDGEEEITNTQELTSMIEEQENIGALVALSERATLTSTQILSRLGLSDEIALYGFDRTDDTLALLEAGSLQALIGQQHREVGRISIETALKLINGEELSSDLVTVDYELIIEGTE